MTTRMPWFRVYVDFLNDPKLIGLAFEDQRHFIGVLALKSDGALDNGASEDLLDRIVAQRLWIDHAVIREVKKRLISAGLIDAGWQPLAWERRQFKSDSSKDRVAKFRAKHRTSEVGNASAQGNADETLPKRASNAVDTEAEAETDTEHLLTTPPSVGAQNAEAAPAASPAEPTAPQGKSRNGKRLPEDWKLPKKWGDWALQEFPVLADAEVRAQAATFADYWHAKAGKDARKLDWEAVWRNWIRRHMEQRGRGGSAPRAADPETPTETFAQRAARQRMEEVAPGVARKAPGTASGFEAAQRFMAGGAVIDVQAREAAPRIEGAAA